MKPEHNEIHLRSLLATGAKKPGELQAALGISQPTLSRLIRRAGAEILSLGATRSTLYALARPVPGVGSAIPVFRVETTGDVRKHGMLHALAASQYYWQPISGKSQLYDHLPWFVQAMRPEGFLGRAFAQNHQALGVPARPEDWNDQHLLTALCRFGLDFPGNLIAGQEAAMAYLTAAKVPQTALTPEECGTAFAQMALASMAGSPPGSSAGGEQPKFGALVEEHGVRHALVKCFRPPPWQSWRKGMRPNSGRHDSGNGSPAMRGFRKGFGRLPASTPNRSRRWKRGHGWCFDGLARKPLAGCFGMGRRQFV